MQDPVLDPHGSSAERIMREFPRHNWLEHKILHRTTTTYTLPSSGNGSSCSSGRSSPGRVSVTGSRHKTSHVGGRGVGDASAEYDEVNAHELGTRLSSADDHLLQQESRLNLALKFSPDLTPFTTSPSPAQKTLDLPEGFIVHIADKINSEQGPSRHSNTPHPDAQETAGHNLQQRQPSVVSEESACSVARRPELLLQQTRQDVMPCAMMARSKSSDALLRSAGDSSSALRQAVKRRRCSAADVGSAEATDRNELSRDWKEMRTSPGEATSMAPHLMDSSGGDMARRRDDKDHIAHSVKALAASEKPDPAGLADTLQRPKDVERASLTSPAELERERLPHDKQAPPGCCAEDPGCTKDVEDSSLPKAEYSRVQPPSGDNALPLDLCVKKSEMLGSNIRPKGNLPVQLVLPQVQPKSTALSGNMTTVYESETQGDIIVSTKQALKVLSDSIADASAGVTMTGGEVTSVLSFSSSRQATASTPTPAYTSTRAMPFSSDLGSLGRPGAECPPQGEPPPEAVPGMMPAGVDEAGMEPWRLSEDRGSFAGARGGGTISRDYMRQSLTMATPMNRHNAEPLALSVDRPDVEPFSSKVELAYPVNLTSVSRVSMENGAGMQGDSGAVCASERDLDREFEKTLHEFRELEMLAARKEQEREQVLAMRKRKAEMLVLMEMKRRRSLGNVASFPVSSTSPISVTDLPHDSSLLLDTTPVSEDAVGVDDRKLYTDLGSLGRDKAGLEPFPHVGVALGLSRLGHENPESGGAAPLDRQGEYKVEGFHRVLADSSLTPAGPSAAGKDREPSMTDQEKRSVVQMINQAVASRKLRAHDPNNHLAPGSVGGEVRSAHYSCKSSNPFINVDCKLIASAVTSPYARRDTPLEEPPSPRARSVLLGLPKAAHSQRPFQPAGSLIVVATQQNDGPSEADGGKPVPATRSPSPSTAHARASSRSEFQHLPGHDLNSRTNAPEPPVTYEQPQIPADNRPVLFAAKPSRPHRHPGGELSFAAGAETLVIDLTKEPSTPNPLPGRPPEVNAVTVDLDVESVIQSELSAAVMKKTNSSQGDALTAGGSERAPQLLPARPIPRGSQHVMHLPHGHDVHGMEVGAARYPTSLVIRRKSLRHPQEVLSAGQVMHAKQTGLSPMTGRHQQDQRPEGEMNVLERMHPSSGVRHAVHGSTLGYMEPPATVTMSHVHSGVNRFPPPGVPSRMYGAHEQLSPRDGAHALHSQQLVTSAGLGHPVTTGVHQMPINSVVHRLDVPQSYPPRPTMPIPFLPQAKTEDEQTLVLRNPMEETPVPRQPSSLAVAHKSEVGPGMMVLMPHPQTYREMSRTEVPHGQLTSMHQPSRPAQHQPILQHSHMQQRTPEVPHHLAAPRLPAATQAPPPGAAVPYSMQPSLNNIGRTTVSSALHHALSLPTPTRPLAPAGPPVVPLYRPPTRLPAEFLSPRPEGPVPLLHGLGPGVLRPVQPANRMQDSEHPSRQAQVQPPSTQAMDVGLPVSLAGARGPFHSTSHLYSFPHQMSPQHSQPGLPSQPHHPQHGFLHHHHHHHHQQQHSPVPPARLGPGEKVTHVQSRSAQHPQQLPQAPQQPAQQQQQQQQQKHPMQLQHYHQQQQRQQPQANKAEGTCGLCGKPAMYLCSNCRHVWYCSQECQTSHWATHAARCKPSA